MSTERFTNKYRSLNDIVDYRNEYLPESIAYRFLKNDLDKQILTSSKLYTEVARLSHLLLEHAAPGDRVILAAQPGLEYIISFLACMRIGAIAVPVFPPATPQMAIRLLHIIHDAKPRLILSDKMVISSLKKGLLAHRFLPGRIKRIIGMGEAFTSLFAVFKEMQLPLIAIEQREQYASELPSLNPLGPQDIAFLQYTSGSTGNPKGVILTHGNLLNNMAIMKKATGQNPDSHIFSWLPPYHDMGLIGAILEPLYANVTTTLMSPQDFIEEPLRWVKNMSRFQATITAGPNFAYELCARRATDTLAHGLDLSALCVAVNGAEPVSAKTIDLFYEKFKHSRLRKNALFPSYGLAEATLLVSSKTPLSEDKVIRVQLRALGANQVVLETHSELSLELVSSGTPHMEVRLIDPETKMPCEEHRVGEIWIKGDSIGQGYYHNEEETNKTFKNRINTQEQQTDYLKTGDLGFFHEGHLFICGRIKDVIIINGQNYYPQDFERIVMSSSPHIKQGNVIAFAQRGAITEQLSVVAELKTDTPKALYAGIVNDIQQALSRAFHLSAHKVYLTPQKTIPKTTSGKLQRSKCAELINNNKIKPLYIYQAVAEEIYANEDNLLWINKLLTLSEEDRKTQLLQDIKTIVSQVMHMPDQEEIDINMNFWELGIDSLMLNELISTCNAKLYHLVNLNTALHNPSIQQLVECINTGLKNLDLKRLDEVTFQQTSMQFTEIKLTTYPMTARQLNFYLSDQVAPQKTAYNISIAIKLNFDIELERLENALLKLVNTNFVFNSQVKIVGNNFYINETNLDCSLFQFYTHCKYTDENMEQLFNKYRAIAFNLEQGPLFRIILFEGKNGNLLQIVSHHLISDGVTMKLFVKQLLNIYHHGEIKKASQYSEYSQWLEAYKKSLEYIQAQNYWDKLIAHAPAKNYLNAVKDWDITFNQELLDPEQTRVIKEFCKFQQISVQNLFIYAYYLVLCGKLGTTGLTLGGLFSGRTTERWDTTMGVFVNLLPITFDYANDSDLIKNIKDLQKQIIQSSLYSDYTQINQKPGSNNQKLFEFIFVYQVTSLAEKQIKVVYRNNGLGLNPFVFEVRNDSNIELIIKYNKALFSDQDISCFTKEIKEVCNRIINNRFISQSNPFPIEKFNYLKHKETQWISLISTFTIEPIQPFIEYWLQQMNQHYHLDIGDFNQVIQNLFNEHSLLYQNEINFVFISLSDWFQEEVDQTIVLNLINAIEFYIQHCTHLIFLMFTPPPVIKSKIDLLQVEQQIQNYFQDTETIYIKTHTEFLESYPITDYFNELTFRQGGIPYTEELYMGLATYAVRQLNCLQQIPKKVIVVDGDNTLWEGGIGEDGVQGVRINLNNLQLQKKLLELKNKGFLLALSSKNILADVQQVFDLRHDMLLDWNDFVLTKVDWNSKAKNLLETAKELNLGLNSFIFIDDNPLECHEIETSFPEVEVIQFPQNEVDITKFLANIWSFDVRKLTKEDSMRTEFYNQDKYRNSLKNSINNLNEFINQLNLIVTIKEIVPEEISRVSQLSMRTNQFNTTSIRSDEKQVTHFIQQKNSQIFTVTVSDKFGDYGLVGAMLIQVLNDRLLVNAMFLSCRSLGRGVEQQMHERLIKICKDNELNIIEYQFKKTDRNTPAENFLNSLCTKINLDSYQVILNSG